MQTKIIKRVDNNGGNSSRIILLTNTGENMTNNKIQQQRLHRLQFDESVMLTKEEAGNSYMNAFFINQLSATCQKIAAAGYDAIIGSELWDYDTVRKDLIGLDNTMQNSTW